MKRYDYLEFQEAVMEIKRYNKLVRDKIPDIIEQTGKFCMIEILSDDRGISIFKGVFKA